MRFVQFLFFRHALGGIVEWLQCRLLFILCIARRVADRVNGNNIARQNNNYFIS